MTELDVKLNYLRSCISNQRGAMKAFNELREFLTDEADVEAFLTEDENQGDDTIDLTGGDAGVSVPEDGTD